MSTQARARTREVSVKRVANYDKVLLVNARLPKNGRDEHYRRSRSS